ncbi:hypothetical protein AYI70_g391 [Smittium culicis]|uniref:Uncharacterized protein n=1 Tax=Smittium culicis TaxID=133412 RepID=A0A1R1YH06_9FUNG|nr:hypothetical protein AYI70_g391 [Smittium culicis]
MIEKSNQKIIETSIIAVQIEENLMYFNGLENQFNPEIVPITQETNKVLAFKNNAELDFPITKRRSP